MPKRDPEELLRAILRAPTSAEEDVDRDEDDDEADDPEDVAAIKKAFAEARAMDPEERRKELREAGIDMEAVHEKVAARLGRGPANATGMETGTETKTGTGTETPNPTATPTTTTTTTTTATATPTATPTPTSGSGSPSGKVIPLRPRLNRALVLPLAAGLVAASSAALYSFGPWLQVAQNDAAPSSTTPLVPTAPPAPEPNVLALRHDGVEACKKMDWVVCRDKLTLANRLDPAGANDSAASFALNQAVLALNPRDGGADPNQRAKQPDEPDPDQNWGPR